MRTAGTGAPSAPDPVATRREMVDRLVHGVGARPHDHDHTLGLGMAHVLEQAYRRP